MLTRRILAALALIAGLVAPVHAQAIGGGPGFGGVIANVNITSTSASIPNTSLINLTPASPAMQQYTVSVYLGCTVPGTGNNQTQIQYTDDTGSQNALVTANQPCGSSANFISNVFTFRAAASTAIQYSTTYVGTGTWALSITAERMF